MIEQTENLIELSSRKRRIAAFLIDHFVMTFLMVSMVFIALGPDFIEHENTEKVRSTMFWVMLPGLLLYLSKDSIKGISIGKWIMGIMVRNESNSEIPNFAKLFIRNLLIVIWPIEFIVLAISSKKKRLGDLIAKTKVLRNAQKSKKLLRVLALISIGLCFFFFTYYFAVSAMKKSEAYKVAIEHIELNEQIISSTGGILGYGSLPKGNISVTNGYGQAQLQINVLGNENDIEVHVYLEKAPDGEWIMKELK